MQRKKIAVAGATGRVGHHLVEVVESRGHEVAPISRSTGIDLITREGLDEALVGVDAIVDAATGPSPDQQEATDFFATAARHLQESGQRAGASRIVVVSIIGTDHFTGGYGAAKLAHERAMRSGPIPAQILRAAQFHEFVGQLVDWGRQGDVSYVPEMRTQVVAARAVAERLADLATSDDPLAADAPILEIAGPRPEILAELATLLVARRGDSLRIETAGEPPWYTDSEAAKTEREINASGMLLPGPGAVLAGPTFEEWLETEYAADVAA